MAHVDVKLEGHGKLVVHQAGGNKNTLGIAAGQVAVAHSLIAEGNVVALSNQGVVAVANRQRHKVIGFLIQRGGNRAGHCGHHALQVIGCERGLAKRGIANPVGGLGDLRRADNLFRPPRRGMGFKFGSL